MTYERYERQGYAHFRLLGVRYANARVEITAKEVESATPALWFLQRLRGAEPIAKVDGWKIQRIPDRADAVPSKSPSLVRGMPSLQALLRRIRPRLSYWVPHVQLSAGEVRGIGPDCAVAAARWQDSALTVDDAWIGSQPVAFVLATDAAGPFVLTANGRENEARLRLTWTNEEIKGEAALWDQPVQLSARFPTEGWLPTETVAAAANWQVPASRLKLGAPYAEVRGDGRFVWRDGGFDVTANAKATLAPDDKSKAPPFEASATAHGTLRELTLTALHIDAPFATAKLTAPVTFSIDRPLSAASAQLFLQANLAKLPWIEARGKMAGTINVTGDTAAARQTFEFDFTEITVQDFTIKEAHASGALHWPLLELNRLTVQLDATSSLETHGSLNCQTHEFGGVALVAKLSPTWFERWLPAGADWTTAELAATLEGPLDAPRHQGSIHLVGGKIPPVHPLAVDTKWQGVGPKVEISARAATEKSTVELAGTIEPRSLHLNKLELTGPDHPVLQLTTPAQIVWSPAWEVSEFALATKDNLSGSGVPPQDPASIRLKAKGGREGFFELTAANFPSTRLQDWISLDGPGWRVDSLQASGHVAEGVLNFDITGTGQIEMQPQPARVKLVARGDAHGIELKEVNVVAGDRVLTQAKGRLPLAWRTETAPHLSIDETAPLELSASTEPDSPLWATLAAATGLELTKPTAKIELTGTLRQPAGELNARVARLAVAPGRFKYPVPEFDDLVLALEFGREKIAVTSFTAKLDGQGVTARGQLPMNDAAWKALRRAPASFDWSKGKGRVEIADADLAVLAKRWPNFPAAQGRLSAHVDLANGGKFSGALHLSDAASHPLPAIGALREIKADLMLADRRIAVQKMTATLGGEPVSVDGDITLAPDGAPRLALGLKGRNLPLVRTTGLLLRSDVDLRADTDASGLIRLSGALNVRDCLVLANVDLKTLLPTGLRGVTRQPPYFAVEAEPFRRWPLSVEVRAPSAVRVRTTAYSGTASAHFQLGGTLGEPRAVGELIVDRGQVLFPFATFTVQQGAVRLREADPFHAVVNLNATSLRRDYQMRLEMKGELPTPNVTIATTPAMEAADALLMVMTGQPPAGDSATSSTGGSGPRLALLGAYLGRGLFQDLGLGGEDRLEVSSGEHISRQGRETYEFEYKLGERWSLLGEYDQFDSYNAAVKWRAYIEESKPREKK